MASKLLSPVATGTFLYALTRSPPRVRLPLLILLRRYASAETVDRLIATLKVLFALGLTTRISNFLSRWAESNFRSEKKKYTWNNEVAVITGATGGFGTLMSKGLARKGVRVIALDIRDELPEDLKNFGKIHYYKCDVTDRDAVMAVADEIRRVHGDPSILINNAGVSGLGRVLNLSEQTIRQTFDVNVVSHYWTIQAFLPAMVQQKKGHVVSISSMAAFAASPGLGPYSCTKAGVMALHEGIRQEARVFYKAPEIQFTIVHPTFATTPMTADFKNDLVAARMETIPPELVADAVVKQIVSGRGRQIILRGNLGPAEYLRSFPHWMSTGIFMLIERFVPLPF